MNINARRGKIPFVIRLTKNGKETVKVDTGADITTWLPGKHTVEFTVPTAGLESGEYSVEIAITGDDTPEIYLATDAEKRGRFYKLATVNIV